ncbi:alpha/beta-hydrolase [Ganoderma leucocontextum]|nr:alpha/beta-hydrolase [Ganoderma leucocontextum]
MLAYSRDSVSTPTSLAIHWGPCDPSIITNAALSCAFFDIPLDYHSPRAGKGRLALAKVNATQERRGTVFFNPGGPGGSGLEALDADAEILLNLTGGLYDLVSWDPRGVGSLTIPGEIYCFSSTEEHDAFFNNTIELTGIEYTRNFTDAADVEALLSQASLMQQKYEEVGKKCLNGPSGRYLKYVGAAATVRDLVALADALDGPDKPVNYIGISYGTLLGSWFVNMFPERVGKVILDGVVDPVTFATKQISLSGGNIFMDGDKVYEGFVTGCALSGAHGCSIASNASTPGEVDENVQLLLQAAHDAARKDPSVSVSSTVIRSLFLSQMYSPGDWSTFVNSTYPQLAQAVVEESRTGSSSTARDSSGISVKTATALGRRQTLRVRTNQTGVSYTSQAIWCGDSIDRHSTTMLDVFDGLIARSRNVSRMYGGLWPAAIYECPFWPVRSVERYQGPFNRTLANKIIVASNLFDPSTPFANAQRVSDLLGQSATLVRQNGFGHTTLSVPSTCVNAIMKTYLVTGELPDGPVVCEVDAGFEPFEGVNTSTILANMHDVGL